MFIGHFLTSIDNMSVPVKVNDDEAAEDSTVALVANNNPFIVNANSYSPFANPFHSDFFDGDIAKFDDEDHEHGEEVNGDGDKHAHFHVVVEEKAIRMCEEQATGHLQSSAKMSSVPLQNDLGGDSGLLARVTSASTGKRPAAARYSENLVSVSKEEKEEEVVGDKSRRVSLRAETISNDDPNEPCTKRQRVELKLDNLIRESQNSVSVKQTKSFVSAKISGNHGKPSSSKKSRKPWDTIDDQDKDPGLIYTKTCPEGRAPKNKFERGKLVHRKDGLKTTDAEFDELCEAAFTTGSLTAFAPVGLKTEKYDEILLGVFDVSQASGLTDNSSARQRVLGDCALSGTKIFIKAQVDGLRRRVENIAGSSGRRRTLRRRGFSC